MRVKVVRCSGGGNNRYFLLILPDGSQETINNPEGDWWSRSAAVKAKDKLCNLYGLKRENIRFHVVN